MVASISILPFLIFSSWACDRDFSENRNGRRHLHKRAQTRYPPQLTEHESILVNAFSNKSISDSLYFYTHGLHLAGTNESMAQWTADRWAENGFTSRLIEYCEFGANSDTVSL